jgi:hypothetical protein
MKQQIRTRTNPHGQPIYRIRRHGKGVERFQAHVKFPGESKWIKIGNPTTHETAHKQATEHARDWLENHAQ